MTTPTAALRTVLTLDAVRRSVEELHTSNIHEQFLGYLHVRKCAIEQDTLTDIVPNLAEISELLAVPGGPPTKPHFNPVSSRTKSSVAGHWLNDNIAGSFAPGSLRAASRFMQGTKKGKFDLPADHLQMAFVNHLNSARRPVWPLAAFLLRNHSFDATASGPDDLVQGFCDLFLFESMAPGSDFDTLFTVGDEPDIEWFTPLTSGVDTEDDEESADD